MGSNYNIQTPTLTNTSPMSLPPQLIRNKNYHDSRDPLGIFSPPAEQNKRKQSTPKKKQTVMNLFMTPIKKKNHVKPAAPVKCPCAPRPKPVPKDLSTIEVLNLNKHDEEILKDLSIIDYRPRQRAMSFIELVDTRDDMVMDVNQSPKSVIDLITPEKVVYDLTEIGDDDLVLEDEGVKITYEKDDTIIEIDGIKLSRNVIMEDMKTVLEEMKNDNLI